MKTAHSRVTELSSGYDQPRLHRLPLREQPAYRVIENAANCSLTELLATLIGGPRQLEIAEALLAHFGGDLRRLYQAHPDELAETPGVTDNIAARIRAALNLGVRLSLPGEERPVIHSPADVAALVQAEMSLLETENLRVILLDTRNHVLDVVQIYEGSVNASQVRIAEVLKPAVRRNAPAVVVVHNHPSGTPDASPDDVAVTRAIVQAGRLLDISVLDHVVIGHGSWISMKEKGQGFS